MQLRIFAAPVSRFLGGTLLAASLLFWLSFAVFESLRRGYLYQPTGFRQVIVSLVFYSLLAGVVAAGAELLWLLARRARTQWPRRSDALLFALNLSVLVALVPVSQRLPMLPGWVTPFSAWLMSGVALAIVGSVRRDIVWTTLTCAVPSIMAWSVFPHLKTQIVELNQTWLLLPACSVFVLVCMVQPRVVAAKYQRLLLVPCMVLLTGAGHIAYAASFAAFPPSARRDSAAVSPVNVDKTLPDILLVVIDTLRSDHVGAYGYSRPTTQHLDSLAATADRYVHAYSPYAYTHDSHRSLFTGRYADHELATTLAEELQSSGYRTIALTANPLAIPEDLRRGFDHILPAVHNLPGLHGTATIRTLLRAVPFVGKLNWFSNRWLVGDVYHPRAAWIVDRAIAWLEADEDGPTFLFVNLLEPHDPYRPPQAYAERFPGYDPYLYYHSAITSDFEKRGGYTSTEAAHVISQYDAEIAYADAQLGRLFAHLRSKELFDQTLVAITSDHGEGLGDHGAAAHGWFPFEEQTRVPLLVKHVEQRSGRTIDGLWSLVDVKQIILNAAFDDEATSLQVAPVNDPNRVVLSRGRGYIALRKGPWKLFIAASGTPWRLYNIDEDPLEQHDQLTLDSAITQEVISQLSVEGVLLATEIGFVTAESLSTDFFKASPELTELLRALGYVR